MSIDVSPDGKQIVFDLLGDLYVIPSTGGDAKRLTSGPAWDCQPRFSPNGKQIAFISDRNGSDNLWLINVDGSQIESKEAKKGERRDGRSAGIAGVVAGWKLHRGAEIRAVSGADGLFALYEPLDVSQGRRQRR